MQIYGPNLENDIALVQWWQTLVQSGDIHAYPDELKVLSSFLASLQEPTTLLCEADEKGLWFCFWYRPSTLNFAIVNLWIREDHRATRDALKSVHLALREAFHHHVTIIAYCGDPAVAALYEHFGLGRHHPDIYVGTQAISVFSLTQEQYEQLQKRSA